MISTARSGKLAPAAAGFIAAEMVLFALLFVASGSHEYGHVAYRLVVAAVSGFGARGTFAPERVDGAVAAVHS